jgi:hypothetical protein
LINFSARLLRKGFHEFAVLPPPLNDSFDMYAAGTTVDLLNHSMVQGMTGIDDILRNSGELHRLGGDDRER